MTRVHIDLRSRQVASLFAYIKSLAAFALLFPLTLRAQFAPFPPVGSTATIQQGSVSLNGMVLNANTKQPIPRVLVQLGNQRVLTQHDGSFQFIGAAGSSAMLRFTKPGYDEGLGHGFSGKRVVFNPGGQPVRVFLFPEALVIGTILAPNGEPLAGVFVQAFRQAEHDSEPSWQVASQTASNSDGQFRLPLGAGDYVIQTRYAPEQPSRHQAILPTSGAAAGESAQPGNIFAFHLDSGAEQHIELRPRVSATHYVHIHADLAPNQRYARVEAHLPNGLSFYPVSRQTGATGDLVVALPSGTYNLTLSSGDREGAGYSETSVDVGESDVYGVLLHEASLLSLPVEVLAPASTGSPTSDNQSPNIQQLGLSFVRRNQSPASQDQVIYPQASRGAAPAFTLPPGSYRLATQSGQAWFIQSATVGGTDLLTDDLDVASGQTSAPLRIVVSNQTAGIKGTVVLDGTPAINCYVYLVSSVRGIFPVIATNSGTDGHFSQAAIPPGSYRAIAFESRQSGQLNDPATLDHLSSYVKNMTLAGGEVATLDLEAVPDEDLRH